MELKYNLYKSLNNGTDGTFKVPKYSPLCLEHPGWKDVLSFADKGKVIYYSKNNNGEYRFGTHGVVDYADPKGQYVIVAVDTCIDSWFEILQPQWDCLAPSSQELIDGMEASMAKMKIK